LSEIRPIGKATGATAMLAALQNHHLVTIVNDVVQVTTKGGHYR
jgi:hypothetical protein